MRVFTLATSLAVLALVGCGGSDVPQQQLSESTSDIRAAEELGADRHPRAALHLKMARDQMRTARALIADGDGDEAYPVLVRAEADAELALTLAREARMRAEAREAMNKVRELRQSAGSP